MLPDAFTSAKNCDQPVFHIIDCNILCLLKKITIIKIIKEPEHKP